MRRMFDTHFMENHPSPQQFLPSATELPRCGRQLTLIVVGQLGQLAQHSPTYHLPWRPRCRINADEGIRPFGQFAQYPSSTRPLNISGPCAQRPPLRRPPALLLVCPFRLGSASTGLVGQLAGCVCFGLIRRVFLEGGPAWGEHTLSAHTRGVVRAFGVRIRGAYSGHPLRAPSRSTRSGHTLDTPAPGARTRGILGPGSPRLAGPAAKLWSAAFRRSTTTSNTSRTNGVLAKRDVLCVICCDLSAIAALARSSPVACPIDVPNIRWGTILFARRWNSCRRPPAVASCSAR